MIAFGAQLSPTVYWYLTRGTGVVALLLLTTVVVLGILGPLRVSLAPRWPRFALDLVHRDLSLLAVVVIAMHVVVSVLDGFAPISLIDGVIPFVSGYRPLWLGLGALAFDLMLALVATSLVRRRLGHRAWLLVHLLAYAAWPLAVLHGLGTGTDANQAWSLVLTFGCVALVAAATLARIGRTEGMGERARRAAIAFTVSAPVAIAVFAWQGPLSANWAGRAGTPARLLVHATSRTADPSRTGGSR